MESKWKIFFIILFFLIASISVFAYITYIQIKEIEGFAKDESIVKDSEALAAGDCTKISVLEQKYRALKNSLNKNCWNPIFNYIVKEYSPNNKDLCLEMKNPDNEYSRMLDFAKKLCSKKIF